MAIARVLTTAIRAVEPMKTLMTLATSKTITPQNSHLLMPDKSRLITVERLAITKKMPAVPPKAVITRLEPFLKPSTRAIMPDSMMPMKKVKASNTGTPAAEFLVFSMAYIKANAPPKNTTIPMMPPMDLVRPVATPSHAPKTVGTRLKASSQ